MGRSGNMTRSKLGTDSAPGRAIVLDVVGLRPEHLDGERTPKLSELLGGSSTHLRPQFPALTVPAQTTMATGQSPATHGDIASGSYDRTRDEVEFWSRDRGDRERIWEAASEAGLTTGVLFFQHLIGTTADVAITPSPIEDEDHNLIEMNCWTNPDGLYEELRTEHGHFPLHNYWGPAAGEPSSRWIFTAARKVIERFDPDLLWVYVSHLDYIGLRTGPDSEAFDSALETVDGLVGVFLDGLREDDRWSETVVNVVSEYGFHGVDTPVFPNRALRAEGLLSTRDGDEGEGGDVDLDASDAFALVDHQLAHVYVAGGATGAARQMLADLDGVDRLLVGDERAEYGIDHPDAGDLVLVAEPDAWFQYYWWTDPEDAPDYARSVDIHRKPGFDPCELFLDDDGMISLDPTRVGGSHGRVDDPGRGCYGLGGPAAPETELPAEVDARAVAPTLAALLGVEDDLGMNFEVGSAFD